MCTNIISRLPVILLKLIFLICFFISGITAAIAGNNGDTAIPRFFAPHMYYAPNMYIISKVTIHLMSREKVKGEIIEVNDSSLLISKGDSDYKSISISEIRSVRIKRNGVVKGLGYGVIIGGILGYGIGHITYNDDSYDEDPPEQQIRG